MPYTPNYPADGATCIDDNLKYRSATTDAVDVFKRSHPYRGTLVERKRKFRSLHRKLNAVYGRRTKLNTRLVDGEGHSGSSNYSPHDDRITLSGKLSVVTYLHEYAHALGRDERGACRWSLNLFKRAFPRSFARVHFDGHCLIAQQAATAAS
ncbi:MAG: hypothetical protein HQ559_01620 [Lentisphaerae bacterium]|nr:hypothetical protein [Lentisphaerota bacterium]